MDELTTESSRVDELTTEGIRARVASLGDWFHNLDLHGVQTAPQHMLGDYPRCKWQAFQHTLPGDLRGCTVLDIGCNAGFYALEMKKRGAARVVGIDTDAGYLAQARFAAQVHGLAIELRQLSVYDIDQLGERFDIVLFMGVLYHLRHPLLALDLIHRHAAADLLVFQSMLRGSPIVASIAEDYPFWERDVFDDPTFPKLHFIENLYAGDPSNWWIPNRACAVAMLRSAGFGIVDTPDPEVFICRRDEARGAET